MTSEPPASSGTDGFTEDEQWLQGFLPFSNLDTEIVKELSAAMVPRDVVENERLVEAGSTMGELLVLRHGAAVLVDTKGGKPGPKTQVGPGAVFGWKELLMVSLTDMDVEMASPGLVWSIPGAEFARISAKHPSMARDMYEELSEELAAAENAIEEEKQRMRVLQPYLITSPKRGIIGNSRYAKKVRQAIVAASRQKTRGPVLVFGEPGLNKDNVAALIHFGSPDHSEPMVGIDCTRMDSSGAELFGRGAKRGILWYLRNGTLLLNNVHQAPPALLPQLRQLLTSGVYVAPENPFAAEDEDKGEGRRTLKRTSSRGLQRSSARFLLVAETRTPLLAALEPLCTTIKMPPLRLRPADILPIAEFFLAETARRSGKPRQRLTGAAKIRIESYKYPENITELKGIVARAAKQTDESQQQIGEDVFWFAAQDKDRFRLNLLDSFPPLRTFLRSSTWPADINFKFTAPVYAMYVALLFILPQDRAHNFGLNLFWDWWWPGIFLVYPFLGRIWCSVCPFMIYGELVQRWRTAQGAVLRKWPRQQMDQWGPWFLYALFFGILVWEEVWELNNTAYLSAWLLLIITAGAMICSAFFERRMWCRYLCPIGGMNGMFAKLSMTEVRGREGVCSASCSTYHCYKGGPAEGEGLATAGCPLHSHPAQLTDNRNCVLCMDCLKACPNRSVEVRLRPPGIDLWTTHQPSAAELCLMFMLFGSVYVHRFPEMLMQLGMDEGLIADKLPHILATSLVLAMPGALCWGADALGRTLSPAPGAAPKPFLSLAYGYLPLVWAATLAHYLQFGLTEAGRILPVTAATFGFDDWGSGLPVLVAHPAVVAFLQGSTLLAGAGLSLLLTRKLGGVPWRSLLPQCATILVATGELWALIL